MRSKGENQTIEKYKKCVDRIKQFNNLTNIVDLRLKQSARKILSPVGKAAPRGRPIVLLLRFEKVVYNKKYNEKGNVYNYTLKPSVRAVGGPERKRKKKRTFFAPMITDSRLTL